MQSMWREVLGNPFDFPDIGARGASILTLGLVLYPYVFLIVREAFSTQGLRSLEVAQSFGLTPVQGFLKVSLPMARPFIVAGLSLAVMECLADFGTVKIYNYTTVTTAIYQSWFALYSLESALQLSLVLITLVLIALLVEMLSIAFPNRVEILFPGQAGKPGANTFAMRAGFATPLSFICVSAFAMSAAPSSPPSSWPWRRCALAA